jgi:tubulin polyglutamylase TTLL5
MIDTEGACHLIEINASPSLERSYMIDEIVKQSLIDDILDIVDPPNFDKEQLLDIMGERLAGKKKVTPEEDLIAIARVLKYKPLRKLGEIPESVGLFEMIAPSKLSNDLERQIKGRSGSNNPKNID